MATLLRGTADAVVQQIMTALDAYEADHPGATADLYRQNAGAVRVRVVDRRFEGTPKSRRHDHVWDYLADRVPDDTLAEVSQVLTIAPAERGRLFANFEFEQPTTA